MDKLRRALSGDEEREDVEQGGGFNEIIDASTLSWSTRVKGFAFCFVLGLLLSLLGSFVFFLGKTTAFGIFYTLGSITSLASTMFLMGPLNQLQKMFSSNRAIATVIMLASIILTLFFAFWTKKGGLVLLFVIIQFCAMTWYSLSYIPYARDAVKKMMSGICT